MQLCSRAQLVWPIDLQMSQMSSQFEPEPKPIPCLFGPRAWSSFVYCVGVPYFGTGLIHVVHYFRQLFSVQGEYLRQALLIGSVCPPLHGTESSGRSEAREKAFDVELAQRRYWQGANSPHQNATVEG